MRKGIILNLKKFRITDYVNINRVFIGLSAVFLAGIAIGSCFLSKNTSFSLFTEITFKKIISLHNANGFFNKIIPCFLRYFLIILLYFLAGNSMLGVAIIPFIIAWQGIFCGNFIAYIYKIYGINGIAFNAIIIIPPTVFFTVVCFFAARYAINFSLLIAKLTLPRSRPASLYCDFKNYCSRFLILFGVSFLCTIFEILLNLLLLKYFIV